MIWIVFPIVLGIGLVGLWVFSVLTVRKTERRFGLHGKLVRSHGISIHYVDVGPTEAEEEGLAPIVLIHGASGNLRDFEASILPELARKHRVIAFDRPGHGWSERPGVHDIDEPARQAIVLHDALCALGVEHPVILGHSWGGAVATAYGLQFGEEMSGLVIMSGATHPWKGSTAWYHRVLAKRVLGPLFLWLIVIPFGRFLADAGVASNFAPDPAPAGYAEAIGLSLLFRPKHFRHNSTDTRKLRSHLADQSQRYDEIALPTIIITGTRDQTVLAKLHSYALHEQITGSELVKLQGVGHMPHHVRPDVVIDAVTRLAAGGAPKPGVHVYPPETDAQRDALS
ncbi:MAG: alpha/beta hydrolase [Rhodobiaceae bacterium]|nr:alpha/beta hydrolase [Rhodobiaceae bacterium]